jgi:hypothetical protein
MTHFPSKRLPRRGVVPAAVPALVTRFSGPQQQTGAVLHVPGAHPAVQAAVDAVPGGDDVPLTIALAPGTYREKVLIGVTKPNIVLQGTGQDRPGTVIVYDTPAAYGGSSGSATVRIAGSDVTARRLTFGNDFDEAAHELNGGQALAEKPGCQGRPGWQDPSGASLTTRDRVIRNPYGSSFPREPDAVGQVLIRETEPPAAVTSALSTGMSGFPWRDARLAEYRNHGEGAAVSADRLRPTDAEDYFRGADGLAPYTH